MHCFAKDIAKNFLPHIFFLNHCNKSPLSKYKMNETIQHTDVTVFAGWKPVAAGLAVTRTAVLRERFSTSFALLSGNNEKNSSLFAKRPQLLVIHIKCFGWGCPLWVRLS